MRRPSPGRSSPSMEDGPLTKAKGRRQKAKGRRQKAMAMTKLPLPRLLAKRSLAFSSPPALGSQRWISVVTFLHGNSLHQRHRLSWTLRIIPANRRFPQVPARHLPTCSRNQRLISLFAPLDIALQPMLQSAAAACRGSGQRQFVVARNRTRWRATQMFLCAQQAPVPSRNSSFRLPQYID